ncbi:MAG: hypothetical protein J6D03_09395 [Clostridia bacterium]|nr:hypothetical protein [Clostridia bacterium]
MGLLDLFLSSSTNEFNIGDMVRIKLTGQEGNIVSALSDNTYEVELHENGRVEYCKASELEKMW